MNEPPRPGFCAHPGPAWSTVDGMRTCGVCGTRRAADYGALARALGPPSLESPSLEPPLRPHPYGATRQVRGIVRATVRGRGDSALARRDELRRRVGEANRWSARGRL
ncbi:DUF6255 family natural product biosynthesis protein [Streptomyces sp. I05A-00742]|uniref:DUF6255 family natural product biosynthesis protein n=1 Tax=Streptomyces sp. I05A-00742 TaxID=2732853 RepID=UPI001487973B|nr:DUF6255 family natural product biosynthesis protein [Streptomyces sp. I05A-00742]